MLNDYVLVGRSTSPLFLSRSLKKDRTLWIDEEDRPELSEWLEVHPNELPEGGHWVDINES